MAEIIAEELKIYVDLAGRVSATQVVDGYKNGLFRDTTPGELLSGITHTEKCFYKIDNATNTQGVNARFFIADITVGDSRAVLFAGDQRNIVADLTGSERKYGAGRLNADVLASATSIVVDVEPGNGAALIYQAGDELRLADGINKEFAIIDSVVWVVDQATITLTAGLQYPYLSATPTTVSSCIKAAAIECTTDSWSLTSTAGTYDIASYPTETNNLGTVEQTWTGTFTSTTDYTMTGDTVGNVGNGNIASDFSPINADFAKKYLTILAAGFGGSFQIGDTFTVITHPATQPLFCDLIIPPGAASLSNDAVELNMYVESA
ncbi:MAG: hypothetical protein DRQ62_09195 [Gammaproteobacteria bacterium]|nr:MAG: hypothetical protein DRQ62_09195 [Gammaproteobacteria bacterium]